ALSIMGNRSAAATARAVAQTERTEATSLVLRSASLPRFLNKSLKGYASRDLARLGDQIRYGWLSSNKRRESEAAFAVAAIYRKGDGPWHAEELIRQANMWRASDGGAS